MAKKSKKRARQSARRAERRQVPRPPQDARLGLLNRIFHEASNRHAYAAFENEQLREAEERREARVRARGEQPGGERTKRPNDDWRDEG